MYDNSTLCKQTENTLDYSKGLRYTFWGELKNSCSSNSCNLSYLIRQKQNHQKIMQLKFFTINSCISNVFGPYSKVCTVKIRASRENFYHNSCFSKKRASQVTIYKKTCISRFFGPYSKTCTVEVRAP